MKMFLRTKAACLCIILFTILLASKAEAQCVDSAYNFSSPGQLIALPQASANLYNYGLNYTISVWVMKTTNTGFSQAVLSNETYLVYSSSFELLVGDDGKPVFATRHDQGSAQQIIKSGLSFPLNTWTNITIVRNNASMTMYLNGVQSAIRTDWPLTPSYNSGEQINVGFINNSINNSRDFGFKGYIDELQYFSVPLTATDVQSYYNNYYIDENPKYSNLKVYFDFNTVTKNFDGSNRDEVSGSCGGIGGNIKGIVVGHPSWTKSTTKLITRNATIKRVIADKSSICSNGTTNITATYSGKDSLIKWYTQPSGGGTLLGTSAKLTNVGPGNYYARVTDRCGNVADNGPININGYTPTPGSIIDNSHTVPYPAELIPDMIKGANAADFAGQTNQLYTWQQSTDNQTWTTAPAPNNGVDYTFSTSADSTWYRRSIATCGTMATNTVKIRVFKDDNVVIGSPSKNGSIKGFVKSLNGSGVAGITVTAVKQVALKGSPQSFTYTTTTNGDGSYIFNNIFYGDKGTGDPLSVNFTIQPQKVNHSFNPPNRTNIPLTYSQSSYPIDVNFTDETVLAITGKLYQQCQGCLDVTNAPVNTVQAGIDSAAKLTGGDLPVYSDSITGAYSATVNNPGSKTFIPSYKNHLFVPASSTQNVQDNISNLNFLDTTTFTISGKVTDGCGNYMGKAYLLFTDNDTLRNSLGALLRTYSFKKRAETVTTSGHFSVRLPAGRTYRVTVEGFDNIPGMQTSDAVYVNPSVFADFFNTTLPKDSVTRNIDTANATLNLVYHRAPVLQIVGLNDAICNDASLHFVVFKQNVARQFTINVYEGPAVLGCLVKTNDIVPRKDSLAISDSVKILTDVADISGTSPPKNLFFRLTGGVGNVSIVPGVPNIVAPFKKKFEVFYTDKYGRDTSINRNAVVTGIQSPPQTFVTTSPEVPLLILHRPPGDQSYSFWEQTKSIETALRMSVAKSNDISGFVEVKVGASFSAGIGVEIETEIVGSVNNSFGTTNTTTTGNESILSTSTTTKYSTKAGGILSSAGDVYVGGAVNFKYGVSNVVDFNGSCQLFLDEKLIVAPDSLKTLYTYSEDHILNTIIPTLQFFVQKEPNVNKQKYYQNQLNVWQQVVDNNIKNKQNASFVENRSFDGGAGGVEVSKTLSKSESNSLEFNLEINNEVATKIGAEVDGTGIEGGSTVSFKMETGKSTTNSSTTSTTTGYLLEDQDAGDYYSVDIKTDPVYGTPCFDLVAGTSSCPPEPGAQSRDNPQIIVQRPIRNNIDNPLDTALFTINLVNKSESREARPYNLNATKSSYNGIILSVDGVVLGSTIPLPYTLNYLESLPITVKVQRNDPAKYSFTDMELTLTDACTGDVQAVNYITANFKTPCGNINIANPEQDWVINSTGSNSLPVTFNGYTQPNVGLVTVEYAKKGSSNWISGNSIFGSLITPPSTTLPWDVSALSDSLYKVRLRLDCTSGTVIYTPYASGTIDRKAPYVIGKPQPSDNNYVNGDEVSFTYNENINTNNVGSANVQMIRLPNTPLNTSVSGYGNKVTIVPLDYIPAFNGDSIMVIVNNIADLFGNVKTTPDTTRFLICTSPVVVGVDSVKVYALTPSLAENVAGQMEIRFKLPKNATRLTKVNFNIGGTALYNNDYTIVLDSTITKQVGTTQQSVYGSFNGSQGYVYIKQGASEGFIKINPIGDNVVEPDETVIISLASGGDYTLTDSTTATATILNDDLAQPPVITASGSMAICPNTSIVLSVASSSTVYTGYLWSTGETTPTITVNTPGTYTVTAYASGGFSGVSAPVVVTTAVSPGDPSVFGNNVWNVYAWNAGGASSATGNSWNTNYSGYYTNSSLNVNTQLLWNNLGTPSDAAGYQGCPVGIDNHSYSYKRKGVPCGYYQLDVPGHDDEAQLLINGVMVWNHDGCCDSHTNVWTGWLSANDSVEYRITGGTGQSYGLLTFNPLTNFIAPITGGTSVCLTNTKQLSCATLGGVWSSSAATKVSVSSTGVVTGLAAGSAIISYTITAPKGGCSSSVSATVSVTTTIPTVASITGNRTPCAGTTTQLANTTVGGAWAILNTSIATINSTGLVTAIAAGTTTVTYTTLPNSSGCTRTTTASFTVKAIPTVAAITGNNGVCIGNTTQLANTTTGGTWSSSNTGVATVSTTGLVTSGAVGTTNITYTTLANTSGCVNKATLLFSVTPFPTLTSAVNVTTCSGYNFNYMPVVNVSGTTITWTRASVAGISNAAVTTPQNGNINEVLMNTTSSPVSVVYVFVLSVNGCSTTQNVTVTVNPSPAAVAPIIGITAVCGNNTSTLATPTTGGAWSSSNTGIATVSSTGVVSPVSVGTATISYTLTNGFACNSSASVLFTVNPPPTIVPITGGNGVCLTNNKQLSCATAGGTWSSSDTTKVKVNTTNGVITGVASGSAVITYTVIPVGVVCTISTTATITVLTNLPTVATILGTRLVCLGLTTTLTNATPGGTWSSSNPAIASVSSTGVVTGNALGTCNILYTTLPNSAGCTRTATVSYTVRALPTVAPVTGNNGVCVGGTSQLADATAGGTWSSSNPAIASISGTGVVTGLAVGSVTISYTTAPNASGCTRTATTAYTVRALPIVANITGNSGVCIGGTTQLADATTGGTWSSSNTTVASVSSTGLVSGITAGTTIITYTTPLNVSGCTNTATLLVTVNPSSGITGVTAAANPICSNKITTLTATGVTGVGTVVTWYSGPGGTGSALGTGNILLNAAPGTYYAYVTNACGTTPAEASITIGTKLSSTSDTTASACNSFTWRGTTYTNSGDYNFILTNSVGCDSIRVLHLTIRKNTLTAVITNPLCYNAAPGSISVTTAGGTAPYLYKNGATGVYGTNSNFTGLRSGTYTIFAQDATGCASSQVFVITQPPAVGATATKIDATCPTVSNGSITVNGAGGTAPYTYRYGSTGAFTSTNTFTGLKAGSYRVFVNDANGCTGYSIVVVVSNLFTTCPTAIPMSRVTDKHVIAEGNKTLKASISPNPTGSIFNLMVHAPKQEPIFIRIMDITGKAIISTKGMPEESFRFGETLMSGTYLVEVRQGDEVKTLKAVKVR